MNIPTKDTRTETHTGGRHSHEGGAHAHDEHGHDHGGGAHSHTHGTIDPSILSTDRGIWAVKWSFAGLFVTTLIQLAIFYISNSIALLADTVHNLGDATWDGKYSATIHKGRQARARC
jgi:hypothetical protein